MGLVVALLVSLLGQGGNIEGGLSHYVGKDLTKLSPHDAAEFKVRLKGITKEKPKKDDWGEPTPRWIRRYPLAKTQWLLFCLMDAYSVPGTGVVKTYGFTQSWTLTFTSEFATGYRLEPDKVELASLPGFAKPLLMVHVKSQGPFMSVNGGPSKPAFHPEDGIRQYYAFTDEGAMLVRMTTGGGKIIGNSYHGGFPSAGGPDMSTRTTEAWKSDLNSTDPARQLSAMNWLSSGHLNAKDWRKKGFARESVASSMCFESLRADPGVKARLKELGSSSNGWVREQAAFTLDRLAQPLAPVEKSPDWG